MFMYIHADDNYLYIYVCIDDDNDDKVYNSQILLQK